VWSELPAAAIPRKPEWRRGKAVIFPKESIFTDLPFFIKYGTFFQIWKIC
jgi:hypothetical protein